MTQTPNPTPRTTNTLAIISFICGLLGLVGHIARSQILQNPNEDGVGMALAGLIMGYIGLLIVPLTMLAIVVIVMILYGINFEAAVNELFRLLLSLLR